MKKVFKIDCGLYPLGLLTAVTGFGLHVAGHGDGHGVWEMWAAGHTLAAAAFLFLIVWHCLTRKAWFKSLMRSRGQRRRRPTVVLALLAAVTVVSGVALLAIMGANTPVVLLHYKLGILFCIFLIGHSARRMRILTSAVRK